MVVIVVVAVVAVAITLGVTLSKDDDDDGNNYAAVKDYYTNGAVATDAKNCSDVSFIYL